MKLITPLLLLLLLIVSACEETVETETNEAIETPNDIISEIEPEQETPEYPYDSKFNDFAQYIAGIESPGSSLESLQSEKWQTYRSDLEQLWKKTNAKLPVIQDWTSEELSKVNANGKTLFYPFSGADFLHAELFFPEYDNITMFALEPIGTYPELLEKADTSLNNYMSSLKTSMHAILEYSFFRTIAMADDFQSEMDGTLHVLMHFMARTNHEVLYQEPVALLANGDLVSDLSQVPDSIAVNGKTCPTYIGNRFYFKKHGSDAVKTVTYFALNIQNTAYYSRGGLVAEGLNTRSDVVNYLNKLSIDATYLKSASYLLHRPTFSMMRSIILEQSDFVLQDDSGIPIQYFDASKWDLTFYGDYKFPISLFAERHQEDLMEVYRDRTETVKALPFGIGYQYRKGASNMMLAEKKH